MFRPISKRRSDINAWKPAPPRRGLSLIEMLMAIAVSAIVMMGFIGLAESLTAIDEDSRERMSSLQHGQVALMRIQDHIRLAYVNDNFPGFRVSSTTIGSYSYPDCLVVWRPTGAPADPTGKPRVGELVVISPDPASPGTLIELRQTTSSTTCPDYTDSAGWSTTLSGMFTSGQKTTLTNRLRTAVPAGSASTTRGCVRFHRLAAPSDSDIASYRASSTAWDALDWPLDLYGTKAGMRTVVCRIELQLKNDSANATNNFIPLFGAAARSYEVLP